MTLLYFSPVPWNSYSQRPHYFARHFLARPGHRVLWVDPYPTRFPAWKDVRWTREQPHLTTARPERLTVIHPRTLPAEPLAAGRWLNRQIGWRRLESTVASVRGAQPLVIGVGRPSDLAREALARLDAVWTFYDAMDDFPEFYAGLARRSTGRCEQQIASAVDTVITVSSALWTKFDALGAKRQMIGNAFEMTSLPPAGAPTRAATPDEARRPVFGYVGCIASWFDWSLVCGVAEAEPDAGVHIVGPRYQAPPRHLPPNVRLFPACLHAEGVRHMASFSVGLIPFRPNRLTAGVDPIKYYGYRGMGLPVLTTAFGEMAGRHASDGGVYALDGTTGLASAAAAALAHRDAPGDLATFRDRHGWERRFADARLFEDMPTP